MPAPGQRAVGQAEGCRRSACRRLDIGDLLRERSGPAHGEQGCSSSQLNRHKKSINGSRVLVLGAAYKKDVDDMRESPSLRVITLLKERGAEVDHHDPFVPTVRAEHGFEWNMQSVPLTEEALRGYDAVLVLTDHSGLDYAWVVENAQLVVDTRNATKAVARGREKILKA